MGKRLQEWGLRMGLAAGAMGAMGEKAHAEQPGRETRPSPMQTAEREDANDIEDGIKKLENEVSFELTELGVDNLHITEPIIKEVLEELEQEGSPKLTEEEKAMISSLFAREVIDNYVQEILPNNWKKEVKHLEKVRTLAAQEDQEDTRIGWNAMSLPLEKIKKMVLTETLIASPNASKNRQVLKEKLKPVLKAGILERIH